jgi:hypothetical protein
MPLSCKLADTTGTTLKPRGAPMTRQHFLNTLVTFIENGAGAVWVPGCPKVAESATGNLSGTRPPPAGSNEARPPCSTGALSQLAQELQILIRQAGDTATQVARVDINEAGNGRATCRQVSPRICLVNPLRVHASNNTHLLIQSWNVYLACFSAKCSG